MLPSWRQYLKKMKDYDGGMVTSVNQSDFVKTALRLPPDVHSRLHEAAQANGRSYNAEIVHRLGESFEGQEKKIIEWMAQAEGDLENPNLAKIRERAKDLIGGSGLDAMRREVEHLQARLMAANHITKLVETTQLILANALVSAIDSMPKGLQEEHRTIRLLANSIVQGDVRSMGTAFARILEADVDQERGARDAAEVRQFMANLEPVLATKERGEDTEPHQMDATPTDPAKDQLIAARTKRVAESKAQASKKR
jgi:hypothetical protein